MRKIIAYPFMILGMILFTMGGILSFVAYWVSRDDKLFEHTTKMIVDPILTFFQRLSEKYFHLT
jgi:hypothetical protein